MTKQTNNFENSTYTPQNLFAHQMDKNDCVFVIGGITDVPKKEFSEHIEFINHLLAILEFRYRINAMTALRDAEKHLDDAPKEQIARLCYDTDQYHVQLSKFLTAILDSASTGTGQELERAAKNETPIIAIMRIQKQKNNRIKRYFLRHNDGVLEQRNIRTGEHGLSMMVAGNPAIKKIIYYEHEENKLVKNVRHIINKIGWYLVELGEKKLLSLPENIGKFIVNKIPYECKGTTNALKQYDKIIQEKFGLTPRTHEIEKSIYFYEQKLANSTDEKNDIKHMINELKEQKQLLNNILEFNPLRLNHDIEKYKIFRVHASKNAHMFTSKYSTKKIKIKSLAHKEITNIKVQTVMVR